MKKFLSVSLVFILIFTMFASTALANGSDVQLHNEELHEFIEGQLIVSIEPKHDRKSKPSIQNRGSLKSEEAKLKKKGFKLKEALHNEEDVVCTLIFSNSFNAEVIDHMGLVYLIEYDVNDFKSEKHAKREIEKEIKKLGYNVRYVSNNYIIEGVTSEAVAQSTTSTSMHRNQRWHYEMINAPQAWSITEGSRDVKIAVLDTGIDHNHPNLRNFVDTRLSRSFVDNNPLDVNGHGTHVAGTIASYGSVSGVMRNATLVNVKVLGDSGGGSLFAIQQGILYASEIGSDVINMSLGGGGYHRGMDEAAQTAVARGSIVIAASGNDSRSSISYPAAYNSVIAVGSVTSNRTRSSFSNYGNGLEIMAPGSSIYSTYPNGTFRTLNGTSMAAPHVAGVAGLMRSANPNLTVAEARQILRETAQPAGNFFEYGYGIVDAYAAVQRAAGATNSTNTAVTTSKTAYEKGEAINVTTTVTDQNGQQIGRAHV